MLPVKKMSCRPSLLTSPMATPPPLYTLSKLRALTRKLSSLIELTNVTPVFSGGSSSKRRGSSRQPEMIASRTTAYTTCDLTEEAVIYIRMDGIGEIIEVGRSGGNM